MSQLTKVDVACSKCPAMGIATEISSPLGLKVLIIPSLAFQTAGAKRDIVYALGLKVSAYNLPALTSISNAR